MKSWVIKQRITCTENLKVSQQKQSSRDNRRVIGK